MTEYKAGQRVKVEWEGVVARQSSETILVITVDDDHQRFVDLTMIKVTVLDPAGWPPQVGDIWEVDGEEYYVRVYRGNIHPANSIVIDRFASRQGGIPYPSHKVDDFKALNPVLIRRREQ